MLKKLSRQRVFKFLLGGGVAAAVNLALIFAMIEWLGFNTPLLRNIANIIAIELSLIFSFFVYRIWVWPGGVWKVKEIFGKQLPLYHFSAGTAILARVLILFPLLDWWGVNYSINTLVGVLLSATLNYIISDRIVFKAKNKTNNQEIELYYPEGLENSRYNEQHLTRNPQNSLEEIQLFSIVIPAYNEEGSIAKTVESISITLEQEQVPYEILVVNDSSRDRTEAILQNLSQNNSWVRYINNYYPNGFGFAVRCGLENFRGDGVAIVMADSSDSPENIVDYYRQLQTTECVFGSRFIRGGKVIDYPRHKLFINRLANLFVQVLFGLKYNDCTNAFKAYRREVIEGINPLISHHFNLTVELPLKAIIRGYSYTTIPITWRNRQTGVSKLKLKEMGSRYLFIVLSILLEKFLARGDYVRQQPEVVVKNQASNLIKN